MIEVAFAWTIAVRRIARTKRDAEAPLPDFVSSLLNGCIGSLLCLNPRPTQVNRSSSPPATSNAFEDEGELVQRGLRFQEDWAWFANVLDRIVFLHTLLCMQSLFCHSESISKHTTFSMSKPSKQFRFNSLVN